MSDPSSTSQDLPSNTSSSSALSQSGSPREGKRRLNRTVISGIGFSTIRCDDGSNTTPGSLEGAILIPDTKSLSSEDNYYKQMQETRQRKEQAVDQETVQQLRSATHLAESDLIFNSAKVGDYVQNFVLPDGAGRRVELRRLLKKGPVVLVFYRGNWCDYCKLQFAALRQAYPHVKAEGGHLVAISPQNLDQTLAAYEANSSLFNVLSDMGNVVARRFGITFRMSQNLLKIYKKFWNIDLGKYYDANDNDIIPAPATFVIDVTGRITFAFVNPDYTKRASLTDVIAAVRQSRHPNVLTNAAAPPVEESKDRCSMM